MLLKAGMLLSKMTHSTTTFAGYDRPATHSGISFLTSGEQGQQEGYWQSLLKREAMAGVFLSWKRTKLAITMKGGSSVVIMYAHLPILQLPRP